MLPARRAALRLHRFRSPRECRRPSPVPRWCAEPKAHVGHTNCAVADPLSRSSESLQSGNPHQSSTSIFGRTSIEYHEAPNIRQAGHRSPLTLAMRTRPPLQRRLRVQIKLGNQNWSDDASLEGARRIRRESYLQRGAVETRSMRTGLSRASTNCASESSHSELRLRRCRFR